MPIGGTVDTGSSLRGGALDNPPSAKDFAMARYWLLEAAFSGSSAAQFSIGDMHDRGRGVDQDFDEAEIWYRKAAEQGHADAQCNLGNLYFTGRGVEKCNVLALHWFQCAAQQGHPDAASGARHLQSLMADGNEELTDR